MVELEKASAAENSSGGEPKRANPEVAPAPGAFPDLVAGSWGDAVPSSEPELHRTWCLHIRCLERAGLGNVLRAEVGAYVRAIGRGDEADDDPRSDEWKVLASVPELNELACAELDRLPGQRAVALGGRKNVSAVKRVMTEVRKALAVAARPRYRPSHRRVLTRFFAATAFAAVALLPLPSPPTSPSDSVVLASPRPAEPAALPAAGGASAIDADRLAVTGPVPSGKHKWVGLGKRGRSAKATR